MKWLTKLWTEDSNNPALRAEASQDMDSTASRLDEPERRMHDAREIGGVLDFLQRTQQVLILTTPLTGAMFHARLQEIRHDKLILHPHALQALQTPWHSLQAGAEVQFSAMAPMGSVQWRVPVRETHADKLVTAAPRVLTRLQSRRFHRIVGLSGRRFNAKLMLSRGIDTQDSRMTVELLNLSEDGAAWMATLKEAEVDWQRGQVVSDCRLELSGVSLMVPAIRIVYLTESGPSRLKLGAQLHGLSEEDRRYLRRWLAEAEVNSAVKY